jgi:hypothetical protein
MRSRPYKAGIKQRAAPPAPPSLPLHVNTVTGTGSGTGSAANPMNSLTAAITACAGLPDWEIRVHAPATAPLRQEAVYESSLALTIRAADPAQPFHIRGSDVVSGWAGAGPVYSKALGASSIGPVIVTTMTETIGAESFDFILMPTAGTQTAPAAGEYGFASGTVYVRLPGDVSPASHTIEVGRRNTCIATRGFGKLTIRDVDARGTIVTPILNGLTGQPVGSGHLEVVDAFLGYTSRQGNGLAATGQSEMTVATRVKVRRAGNDGFNLHATAGLVATMILNGCDSSYNGHFVGDSAQGASNHENTRMVLNGGRFDYNVSGGMVVINDAVCDIHGDTEYGAVTMRHNMRLGNTVGTIADQAGCAWLDNSTGTVSGPVEVTDGLGRGVKVKTAGAVAGLGSVLSTRNAVADSIA